jgi:hypothetical protein
MLAMKFGSKIMVSGTTVGLGSGLGFGVLAHNGQPGDETFSDRREKKEPETARPNAAVREKMEVLSVG